MTHLLAITMTASIPVESSSMESSANLMAVAKKFNSCTVNCVNKNKTVIGTQIPSCIYARMLTHTYMHKHIQYNTPTHTYNYTHAYRKFSYH